MNPVESALFASAILFGGVSDSVAQANEDEEPIAEITVAESRVANTRPAGTYGTTATVLRFDPVTELQSRGLPEGQADVTVRGGLFENTGFRVGAVTIMDPQTGHYAAELPVDPSLLTPPDLLMGVDNALAGFNSNIATISYAIPILRSGGSVSLGAGSDELKFGTIRLGGVHPLAGGQLALAVSAAGSRGDGTVPFGDHDFQRYNLQLQHSADRAQTDLVVAYQDKFYGWPGAYTGFASLLETDATKTTMLVANHRREYSAGWWQVSAFHRRLEDDYDFDRTTQESGAPGSFDHETRVAGIGFDGVVRRGSIDWHYAGQLTSDRLVSSTDLTNSDFTSRSYANLSVLPTMAVEKPGGRTLSYRFGGTFDISSEDDNAFSPLLGVELQTQAGTGTRVWSIEYAATSQVPGYTALGSGPSGLFGGNAALGRETARQLLLSIEQRSTNWNATLSGFYRRDNDLVDWTFDSQSPFARQANAVDIDVFGVQILYGRNWNKLYLRAGYTFLDKDADYGAAVVDASFYALNFARHRATLALRYLASNRLELRIDNQYRDQEANPLRSSSDQAFLVSASVEWRPGRLDGFGIALTADNLTDDDYQQFPGTPAIGRQVSVSARYDW